MAWSEVFTALQQGVIDGQENPIITLYANNFQEVQKYISPVHYNLWIAPIMIGVDAWSLLSSEQQEILLKAVTDAASYEQQWAREYNDQALQALLDSGMEYCVLEDEEVWKSRARSVWPDFHDRVGGKELVEEALAHLAN